MELYRVNFQHEYFLKEQSLLRASFCLNIIMLCRERRPILNHSLTLSLLFTTRTRLIWDKTFTNLDV